MCEFTKIVMLLLLVVSIVVDLTFALRGPHPSCRSRDTCIRLTECRSYMNLIMSLRRPLSPSAVMFLRSQECGFDGSFPMVCCFQADSPRPQVSSKPIQEESLSPAQMFSPHQNNFESVDDASEEQLQLPSKPDFTPYDLSDYRSAKESLLSFPVRQNHDSAIAAAPIETTTLKTTTTTKEMKTTTAKVYRRQNIYDFMMVTTEPPRKQLPTKDAKAQRQEDLKKKMEAINHAFTYSSMDYFFVRRMLDAKNARSVK